MKKKWLKAAARRAVRSFAQGALASIGSEALLSEINWCTVLCTAALAALVSVLMSLAGLPEVRADFADKDVADLGFGEAGRPEKCVRSISEIMEMTDVTLPAQSIPAVEMPDSAEKREVAENGEGV